MKFVNFIPSQKELNKEGGKAFEKASLKTLRKTVFSGSLAWVRKSFENQ
jgi:hypothetical protein